MTASTSPLATTRLAVSVLLLAMLSACGGGGGGSSSSGNNGPLGAQPPAPVASQPSDKVLTAATVSIRGEVRGLNGSAATVILGNQGDLLRTVQTDSDGKFAFTNVPSGAMFVKVEATGFLVSTPQSLVVSASPDAASAQPTPLVFSASASGPDTYSFHWDNMTGTQESGVAHVNAPPVVKYLEEASPPSQTGAVATLLASYNIVLSNNGIKWTQEYASRLLALLGTIPTRDQGTTYPAPPFRISKWELTDQFIDDDIRIQRNDSGDTVLLSIAAFVYATPRLVTLDGVQGRYFSKRLHHALVRFATQDGNDADAAEQVLTQRYGVSTKIDNYEQLTAGTTHERADKFARFKPAELVTLINAMEEMNESFHKIKGLKYLVRRAYGGHNPDNAAYIAQAFPSAGYIEFTDQAMQESDFFSPQRVILHEKAHFLWVNVFSDQQKNDWIKLGGWTPNPLDASKWTTSQTTQFVSAYGHDTNPAEDMAESLSTYIVNSNLLQSRAPEKFNFLKDRIFQGDRFVTVTRQDLTFGVFDLHPDYTAPGSVKQLDIKVSKTPAGDWDVATTIEFFGDGEASPGATRCEVMVMPPSGKESQRTPIGLLPVKPDGTPATGVNATVLKSYNPPFSRFVEGGYWKLAKATCTDLVGNTRYLGPNELGNAVFYIDNPLVSVDPPKYEPGSISILTTPVTVDGRAFDRVTATWRMLPHVVDFASFSATLTNLDGGGGRIYASYTLYDNATRTATVKFDVPDYFKGGHYAITDFQMYDAAGNRIIQFFPDPVTNEQPKSVNLIHPNGDSGAPPELDLNRITVTATPTQPAAPNGETTVKVAFYARDDLSGMSNVRINLLNPQGEVMPYYFFVALTGSNALLVGTDGTKTPFAGDPGAWQRYEATIVLPAGSAPGTWGIKDMLLSDKAGFGKIYDFAEILHFVVSAN